MTNDLEMRVFCHGGAAAVIDAKRGHWSFVIEVTKP
jgi:hypothetical protein